METMFLATIIGWVLVVIGLLFLFRHEHMKSAMLDVIAHPGLFFVFALFTFILGLLMVTSHNIWLMGWPVIVTIFSWLVLINGLFRLFFSDAAMRVATSFLNHPIKIKVTGFVQLIIGAFLLYHVYYSPLMKL